MQPEHVVQDSIRLEASEQGSILWRNNVGVAFAQNGTPVRYGLANDSEKVNRETKSSDLIGIQPVVVTPCMVGTVIGRFLAREIKREGWRYRGTPEEKAQLSYISIVNSMGGNACFATGRGTL